MTRLSLGMWQTMTILQCPPRQTLLPDPKVETRLLPSSAARRAEAVRLAAARRRRTQQEIVELRSRRESFAESSPHELADAHVVDVADGASEIAAEEVHEVKAEARSSRDFSRELGDFFDGLGPAAYAQEAPPPDSESDDETKTPS